MDNTMVQYATTGKPIREAIAERIRQLPNKDIYMAAGAMGVLLFAGLITVCATKSDISFCSGLLEIRHTTTANAVAQ